MESITEKILQLRNELGETLLTGTPSELSLGMSKLATYNVNLGQEVAEAEYKYDDAVTHRKVTEAQDMLDYKTTGMTVSEANIRALMDSKIARRRENELKRDFKQKKHLYHDTSAVISVHQSRLKQLSNEQRQSNLENVD